MEERIVISAQEVLQDAREGRIQMSDQRPRPKRQARKSRRAMLDQVRAEMSELEIKGRVGSRCCKKREQRWK
jgi:hypothetical protein